MGWGETPKTAQRFVKVHWISVGGLIKGREREGEEGDTEGREEGKGKKRKKKGEEVGKSWGTSRCALCLVLCPGWPP